MAKYLTLDLLSLFKDKQDAANENKFMAIENFVDANGKIKADVIDAPADSNVVPIHVDTSGSRTRYYTDNNGVKTTKEVTGATGKIYVDLESNSRCIYTYDAANDEFIPFASSIATEQDIEELFN